MNQFDVTAVSPRIENESNYPAENFQVLRFPDKPNGWESNSMNRYFHYLRNFDRGFYRGPVSESKWLDQQLSGPDRPDLILAHYGTFMPKIMPHALNHRIPVVAHFNGHDASHSLNTKKGYPKQLQRFGPQLAGCVVVANYMAENLKRFNVSSDRIHLVPYGVPCDEFSVTTGINRDPCRFLAVGNFVEKKRPDITLEAFAKCVREVENVELVMIGDGPLMERCKQIVSDHELEGKVRLLGKQLRQGVRDQLREASVFLQHSAISSFGDSEGWPVAIAEASATGLPIVSTRHAGIPDQVDEDKTGFLVDELDVDSMAAAMIRLASDINLRESMGSASRQKALTYNLPTQISKLESTLLNYVH